MCQSIKRLYQVVKKTKRKCWEIVNGNWRIGNGKWEMGAIDFSI